MRLLIALVALVLALASTRRVEALSPRPRAARLSQTGATRGQGAVEVPRRALQQGAAATTSLSYRGGNVLTSGPVVHFIFIGYDEQQDAEPQWMTFLVDNLEGSSWWKTLTKYYRVDRRTKKKTFVSTKPTLGTAIYLSVDSFVEGFDGDLSGEDSIPDLINAYLDTEDGVPYSPNALYVVVPADDNRIQMGEYFCQKACAWHSYQDYSDDAGGGTYRINYAYVPDQQQCAVCVKGITAAVGNDTFSPTGAISTDAMVDALARSLANAVTNPDTETGWFGKTSDNEAGEVCRGVYADPGQRLKVTTVQDDNGNNVQVRYNQILSGNPLVIQRVWRPDINPRTKKQYGCVSGA